MRWLEESARRASTRLTTLRDAEITNIPFLAALAGALRRCNPLVELAKLRVLRLASGTASLMPVVQNAVRPFSQIEKMG